MPNSVAREEAVDFSQITKTIQELKESATNLSRRVVSIVSRDKYALFNPGEKSLLDALPADTQMDFYKIYNTPGITCRFTAQDNEYVPVS